MYLSVYIKIRILCNCDCTLYQFSSIIECNLNIHVMRGESSSSFRTSMKKTVSGRGLTNSLNISSSCIFLFFHSVSKNNLLISLGIMANLCDLL